MASPTVENYLKAMFYLADEEGNINLSDISNHLGVSKPTVNGMVKSLQQEGWVRYEKYKPIRLTEKGRKSAALVIRKHRLTEMFLVEKMGFGWEEVHEIAEQIEHVKAPAFFDRMDMLMDYPKVDPHGSPIPNKEGEITHQNVKKLSECVAGQRVKLIALNNSSKEFLQFLDSREISLRLDIEIVAVEAFDSSMLVKYTGRASETLSQKVCERLLVAEL